MTRQHSLQNLLGQPPKIDKKTKAINPFLPSLPAHAFDQQVDVVFEKPR